MDATAAVRPHNALGSVGCRRQRLFPPPSPPTVCLSCFHTRVRRVWLHVHLSALRPSPLLCLHAGCQALMFAPTELLARQHMGTLNRIIEELPLEHRPRTGLLLGSASAREKRELKAQVAAGQRDILVSTTAALWVQDWHNLGLVIIDEQHKCVQQSWSKAAQAQPAAGHAWGCACCLVECRHRWFSPVLTCLHGLPPGLTRPPHHLCTSAGMRTQAGHLAAREALCQRGRPAPHAADECHTDPPHACPGVLWQPDLQHHQRAATGPLTRADACGAKRGRATPRGARLPTCLPACWPRTHTHTHMHTPHTPPLTPHPSHPSHPLLTPVPRAPSPTRAPCRAFPCRQRARRGARRR